MAKMTAAERKAFFLKAFNEQRHLLKKAIEEMENGDLISALHVATIVRVLVHETGASKPLLKRLDSNYLELPILERRPEPSQPNPKGMSSVTFFSPISAQIKFPEGKIALMTEIHAEWYMDSKIGVWWSQTPCMVLPGVGAVTRKEVVLGLSNKEGGAHVDDDISEKYKNLLESKFFCAQVNGVEIVPLNQSRLTAGRIGVELLESLNRNFPV
jgi:hypothetical protein